MKNRKPPRIAQIIKVAPFHIVCLFTNGEMRYIDFKHLLDEWKTNEITMKLLDFEEFKQVSISESQTLQWTNVNVYLPFLPVHLQHQPYDLDPDVLYRQSTLINKKNKYNSNG